jgi:hypothetical protein
MIFMNRDKASKIYSADCLEIDRPQTLSDVRIEELVNDVLHGRTDRNILDSVYTEFKHEMADWLLGSKINSLSGLDSFTRVDIIGGCTQFIDNLYMQGPVQVLRGDYRYHQRLGLAYVKDVGSLIPDIPLIVAMPFPSIGAPHQDMEEILNECLVKKIKVHIDGAWTTCCRDIVFDYGHPAISSVGISLSKGLGLGWNRVGLRWTKLSAPDSITIMNDFQMNNRANVIIGLHFLRNLDTDYLWTTHGDRYYKICKDFNLTPTKAIHLAMRNDNPVGIAPLIRYLENANIS